MSPLLVTQPSAQALLSLARARVYQRLQRAISFPILVVCAPTGFGKSTVVREFCSADGHAFRCLQLATNHDDRLGFMREFANCLGDRVPALLTSLVGMSDIIHRADEAPKKIATWAAGHLETIELTIMIDGLRGVTDELLFALLTELVDQTAHTRIRWILVAETPDRFPIARWLANERMDLPLDETDLSLTFEDLSSAVEQSSASISRASLRALCRTTGNSPASIALALSDPSTLPGFVGDEHVHPFEFFARRALAARPETERRFLLESCLFECFDAQLLEAAGWSDAQPMLDRLHDGGAFLYAEAGGSYRYHKQFRSFLEDRLRAAAGGLYQRVGAASAVVCGRLGRWPDALRLYTDLQAATPLVQLLSEHGFELMDRGEAASISRALAALGDADFAAFPVALAVKASFESLHGNFDVAEAWFRHAISVVEPQARGAIVFRFATDLVRRDRRDAIDLLVPIVAEGGHELALAVSLAGLLATAYATHGQRAAAAQTIECALDQLHAVDDPAVRAKVYFQAGYVAFFATEPERAKDFAHRALETALASHLYDIAARALSILYNVAMDYEDDVGAGKLYLDVLASCSAKAGSRHLLIYATLAQFEIEVFRGNLRESARLDAMLRTLEVDYSVYASEMLLPAQALRATWTGDFHRAYRLIATTAEAQITPTRQSQRYAEIALYAAAAGLRAEATVAVRAALALLASKDQAGDESVVLSKAYIALALDLLGRHRRAARVLSTVKCSTDLTPRRRELLHAIRAVNARWAAGRYSSDLRDALEQLDASDFGGIARLIEALPLPETFRGQFAVLTAAEREVLVHLSAGLDLSEIAVVSGHNVGSVEGLTRALCRKLGCTSLRHAVALAQSCDVLQTSAAHAG